MTLLDVRTLFVDKNGRYDLVVDTANYVDNGADYYINAGVKLLDRLTSISDLSAIRSESLAIGEYTMDMQHIKSIERVSYTNSDNEVVYLDKLTMEGIRKLYPKLGNTDTGEVAYYAVYAQRTFTSDTETTPTGKRGIMVMPPTDTAITIDIFGKFKSATLSVDADVNFWTILHPEVLIKAANYELEIEYRNTEGANDWMRSILDTLRELDFDSVEEDIAEINVMEDSKFE